MKNEIKPYIFLIGETCVMARYEGNPHMNNHELLLFDPLRIAMSGQGPVLMPYVFGGEGKFLRVHSRNVITIDDPTEHMVKYHNDMVKELNKERKEVAEKDEKPQPEKMN